MCKRNKQHLQCGLEECGSHECVLENIPARKDGFDVDPNLECEGKHECFDLKHASSGSGNHSANGLCSSVSDLAGTSNVFVKELNCVHRKNIFEGYSNILIFADAVNIEEESGTT